MDVKKIGEFIAYNRKLKGLTQEELGRILGVTNKTISRWENGNYMPDLSLLKPLSDSLGVTLNELLSGEKFENDTIIQNTENNIMNTIDFTEKTLKKEHKKISILLMSLGIFLSIASFVICGAESSWSSIYSIIGIIIFIIGLFKELKLNKLLKIVFSIGLFIVILGIFMAIDYIGVIEHNRPPIYRYMIKTTNIISYYNPFYTVYRINANTPNEYYIVDSKNEYDSDDISTLPFNMKKSSIDNIIKYKSNYIGDNSNIGILLSNLPLSEYGYNFEINSNELNLIINYNTTDWYNNTDLYVQKALIYNSLSIFTLIDNVQYIQYNFSGSSYKVTRKNVENIYPNYDKIVIDGNVNKNNFILYVEKVINNSSFIENIFSELFV